MVKQLPQWIDQQKIPLTGWLAAFSGVIFIRFFLEAFSNPSSSGIIASDASTLVHYWLFFLTALLGVACLLQTFTSKALRSGKLVLFACPVLWLAPLIDLARGGHPKMSYLFEGASHLLTVFFVFFLPVALPGWTAGMRIEIDIILFLVGFYVWIDQKSFVLALFVAFLTYLFIFFLGSLPGMFYILAHLSDGSLNASGKDVADFLRGWIERSAIAGNDLHGTLLFGTPLRAFDYGFNALMSQVLFIAASLFGALWFGRAFPEKFGLAIKNCRPERIGFYLSLMGLGMLLALKHGLKTNPFSWIDAISTLTLGLAWFYACMYAIHANDLADKAIDEVSNTRRPLVKGGLTADDMRQGGYVWLIAATIGAFTVGYYPFYMILVFTACYYVYSVPPLRLKRVAMLSSALIAIAALCTVLAGFFFLSSDKKLEAFPAHLALGVGVLLTLGVNIRDIKDIEGDRANKVRTLPVLFGAYGTPCVGLLFALSFALAPLLLQSPALFYVMLPATLIAYAVATRKPYNEKWVFALYFCVIGVSVALAKIFPSGFPGLLD